jgi:hypothetical protein
VELAKVFHLHPVSILVESGQRGDPISPCVGCVLLSGDGLPCSLSYAAIVEAASLRGKSGFLRRPCVASPFGIAPPAPRPAESLTGCECQGAGAANGLRVAVLPHKPALCSENLEDRGACWVGGNVICSWACHVGGLHHAPSRGYVLAGDPGCAMVVSWCCVNLQSVTVQSDRPGSPQLYITVYTLLRYCVGAIN